MIKMQSPFRCAVLAASAMLTAMGFAGPCRADRTVLAPTGETLAPESVRTEFAIDPQRKFQNYIWLQYSTPQGIEMEAERLDLTGQRKKGYAFNLQYPLTVALSSAIPSVSIGVRDLTGTGNEHGAFYLVASKSVPLSDRQIRLVKDLKLDLGAGTGRIGGLFVGAEMNLALGLRVRAEFYKRRPNVTLSVALTRNLDARAYSLDNHLFYGLSFSLLR